MASAPEPSEMPASLPLDDRGGRPVAVVWCRQVDNEAESPGYTTVPDSFPGLKETLDTIRIVGNLTINVADTHDYWDPDPTHPALSYYPNLFLYPAYGGAYTCVGRMFLSTEDRPRLGMKTLVLDTAQLLATGEFGPAVLRWHASMASSPEGARPPPVPDPNLYGYLGEGLLFHKGSTDPVVLVASDAWEGAMQALFELVRRLPTSLIALGAILAFPYFLPAPKINMREFAEELPLALSLMRVPRGEALGERHKRRIESWESAPVTLRDFAAGVPAAGGRGKESLPVVLQFVRDGNQAKLAPIVQRVDTVELPRLRSRLSDTEHQAGKDRRKEMWRIGTAMESAALLLGRARGRHVPVSAETARRVQAYLNAEPPEEEEAVVSPPVAPDPVPSAIAATAASVRPVPSWLTRPAEPPAPRGDAAEPVPVSVSEDPSLLPPPARAAAPPPEAVPPSGPEANLVRSLDAHIEERVRALSAEEAARMLRAMLDARLVEHARAQQEAVDRAVGAAMKRVQELDRQLSTDLEQKIASVELSGRRAMDEALAREMEHRAKAAMQGPLEELRKEQEQALRLSIESAEKKLREEVAESVEDLKERYIASEEELRAALLAQMELEIREAEEGWNGARAELETKVKNLSREAAQGVEAGRQKELRELEQRLGLLVDGRSRDAQERIEKGTADLDRRFQAALEKRATALETAFRRDLEARFKGSEETRLQSVADLQVRMQLHLEQLMRESFEDERTKYLELLARLRSDLQEQVSKAVDKGSIDRTIRDAAKAEAQAVRGEIDRLLREHVSATERRLTSEQEEAAQHLETIRSDLKDQLRQASRLEQSIRTDIDELERRLSVLSDRLVPVVKQTWMRIAAIEKGTESPEAQEMKLSQIRREVAHETRRIESEMTERIRELRERMEATVANQGKVWLTLVRQLSQLTEERRASDGGARPPLLRAPPAPDFPDLGELSVRRARPAAAPVPPRLFDEDAETTAPASGAPDGETEEEPVGRRRTGRRSGGRSG